MAQNDGGPAFAFGFDSRTEGHMIVEWGLSKRDWFAGQEREDEFNLTYNAATLLVGPSPTGSYSNDGSLEYATWHSDVLAAWKYMRADAMLRESQRREGD